jgi:hypothetical protein
MWKYHLVCEVLLGFLPLHLVAQPEARALTCKLCDTNMCLDRGMDIGHEQILTQLMKSDPVFRMGQDKMIPITVFATPFKVEIPQYEHGYLLGPRLFGPEG